MLDNVSAGSIDIDGRLIRYFGLEPIIDDLEARTRVFIFQGGSESINLSDDGIINNGLSFIDSTHSESVIFSNPTDSLTVNAGDGDDTIRMMAFDEGFIARVTVDGGSGSNKVVVDGVLHTPVLWENASGSGVTAGTLLVVGT